MTTLPRSQFGTVVCVASGPSLAPEDVAYVRGKATVIAVNDAVNLAPWADVLYSSDPMWWQRRKWMRDFPGVRVMVDPIRAHKNRTLPADDHGVLVLKQTGKEGIEFSPDGLRTAINSGGAAINLAVHLGAKRILLLGYDMGPDRGRHHFYDTEKSKGYSAYEVFIKLIGTMAQPLKDAGIEVVNCSVRSALKCFPMVPLRSLDWSAEGTVNTPSPVESASDPGGFNTDLVGPLSGAMGLASPSQKSVAGLVSLLLSLGGPFAIVWAIAFVVVHSFNGQALAATHIGQKVAEVHPSVTYVDASSTVTTETCGVRVSAPTDNASPHPVFSAPFVAYGLSVSDQAWTSGASATSDCACRQVWCGHECLLATVASTTPQNASTTPLTGWFYCDQFTGPDASKVQADVPTLVLADGLRRRITNEATTTASVTRSQVSCNDGVSLAAIAYTDPRDRSSVRCDDDTPSHRFYCQATESLTDEVNSFRHVDILTKIRPECLPMAVAS